MSTSEQRRAIVQAIEDCGVVGIIRMKDAAKLPAAVDALAEGGVRTLEITMTVPGAVELIRETAKSLPEGVLLGAGTATMACRTSSEIASCRRPRRLPPRWCAFEGPVSVARKAEASLLRTPDAADATPSAPVTQTRWNTRGLTTFPIVISLLA